MSKSKDQTVVESKRFVMRKKLLGQGAIVKVTFNDGRAFEYDHDEVYKANKKRFEAMPCWAKYKTYTSSTNIPTFARELATKL